MLAEKQSLGTDLRYSSVCLITPILCDHFRFVGNPEAIQKRVLVRAADFYLLEVASSLTFLLGAMYD